MRNLILALVALLITTQVSAATEKWTIDEAHATAAFTIKHMMVTNVSGSFNDVAGKFEIDPADATKMKIEATIDPKSVNTGNPKRDEHLRSADFFDVKKFPKMTFKSTSVTKDGEKLAVKGELTMHGVTKEVTLVSEGVTPAIKDPFGGTRRGFNATGEITRKDFGLVWNKAMDNGGVVLGETVKITIDTELKADTERAVTTKEARKEKTKKK